MTQPSAALTVQQPAADAAMIALAGGETATPVEILAIFKAIDRLDGAVAVETETLRTGGTPWFDDFNYRKSHGLLELTRAMRAVRPEQVSGHAGVRERLGRLRARLEGNRTLLKTHLDATKEISAILTAALRNAESDGTYSLTDGQRGRP